MTTTSLAGAPPNQQQIDQLVSAFTTQPRATFDAQAAAFDAAFPRDYTAQNLLGAIYAHLKDFLRAEAAFRTALEACPDEPETLFVYGVTLFELGRHGEAVAALRRVNALQPGNHEASYYHAMSLHALGQFDAAAERLERLIAAEPGHYRALGTLGLTLLAQGRPAEAIAAFEHALALTPTYTEARVHLAVAQQQNGDLVAAEATVHTGLAHDAGSAELFERLGGLRLLANDLAGAEEAYRRSLAIEPSRVDALNNLGLVLHKTWQFGEALDCFALALRERPDMAALHSNIGFALQQVGSLEEALAAFERALELDPDQPYLRGQKLIHQMQLCDWRALEEYAAVADTLGLAGEAVSPGGLLAIEDNPARQRARAEAYAARYADVVPAPFGPRPDGARIRVGYFSADFHDHATMHLMAGLFRTHDRSRFEITAYSYGLTRQGAQRDALIANVDRFVDVADQPDQVIVNLARDAALDIAVDLKGYTQDNRLGLFAHRLAPVQISYLGYPGTSGAPFLDYIIADHVIVPPEEREHYSEQLIRLPGSYQPNDDQRPIAPESPSRAALGLPETGFVFACFNNAYKITPREFDIWMRLLDAVPGSVLWLFKANDWAEAMLRREAERRGIAPERLIFAPWAAHAEHLARLRRADLFLDTFACNAHTTASDALWTGVPVLTCPGHSFIARVAASLTHAVGLPELAVESDAAYETMALDLARNPARLGDIRTRLAANRSTAPLFDTLRYTRALEAAYVAAHQRHLAGLPPEDFDVA